MPLREMHERDHFFRRERGKSSWSYWGFCSLAPVTLRNGWGASPPLPFCSRGVCWDRQAWHSALRVCQEGLLPQGKGRVSSARLGREGRSSAYSPSTKVFSFQALIENNLSIVDDLGAQFWPVTSAHPCLLPQVTGKNKLRGRGMSITRNTLAKGWGSSGSQESFAEIRRIVE